MSVDHAARAEIQSHVAACAVRYQLLTDAVQELKESLKTIEQQRRNDHAENSERMRSVEDTVNRVKGGWGVLVILGGVATAVGGVLGAALVKSGLYR